MAPRFIMWKTTFADNFMPYASEISITIFFRMIEQCDE